MEFPDAALPELYLRCIQSSGKHSCCETFLKLFLPVLEKIAARVASQFNAHSETEDLVQELSLNLITKDETSVAAAPLAPSQFAAYLSVAATNAARDFFRRRNAAKRGRGRTVPLDNVLESILPGLASVPERELLLQQIEDHLPDDPKAQWIFRLYYRQGFNAVEIASVPAVGLSAKGVESTLHRTTVALRKSLGSDRRPENRPGKPRAISLKKGGA